MIKRLSGTVVDIGYTYIVLDVGGVGYQIYTNSPQNHRLESSVYLHTYLSVRENALDLYGFSDRDTLDVFEMLIGLPKIGPKTALQILTQADIELIRMSVAQNDPEQLHKLSGIGKKSAEKIVSGLKEKFETARFSQPMIAGEKPTATNHSDTIDALISLGYSPQDARRTVSDITSEQPELTATNDIIKNALQRLHH